MFMLASPILEQALTEQSIRVSVCCLCSLHPCTVSDNGRGHMKSPRYCGLSLRVNASRTFKSNPTVTFNMIYVAQGNSVITKTKRKQIPRDKRTYHPRRAVFCVRKFASVS